MHTSIIEKCILNYSKGSGKENATKLLVMISHTSLQQLALQFCTVHDQTDDGTLIIKPTTESQPQVCISLNTLVPQVLLSLFKHAFDDWGFFLAGQSMFYLHLNSKIMILSPCALHDCNLWVFYLQLEEIAHTEFILNGFPFIHPNPQYPGLRLNSPLQNKQTLKLSFLSDLSLICFKNLTRSFFSSHKNSCQEK